MLNNTGGVGIDNIQGVPDGPLNGGVGPVVQRIFFVVDNVKIRRCMGELAANGILGNQLSLVAVEVVILAAWQKQGKGKNK